MARTTHVKSARKAQGTCELCRNSIGVGDPYKWVKPRSHRGGTGRKRVRCAKCRGWRPSELTSSQHLATIYGAQEGFDDFTAGWDGDTVDDLAQAMKDAAEEIRGAGETYRESAQAIEEGFGHATYQSEELEGKADEVESWADEIDSASDDLPAAPTEDDWQDSDYSEADDFEAALDEWREAAVQAADEAMGNCPI